MFKKILVPLDGSELAQQALQPALALAQKAGGEIFLLSVAKGDKVFVAEPVGQGVIEIDIDHAYTRSKLVAYLEGARQKTLATLPVSIEVIEGDAASVIVDTAVSEKADLIVMSTHGRSGFSRWVLGSVTERVLRTAPCPVLVIREDKPFSRIMITLDGSTLSEYALGPGMEIASHFGSHVTLLNVENGEPLDSGFVAELDKIEPGLGARTIEDFFHQTEAYLQRLAQELQAGLEQMIHIAPRTGTVVEAILETIETENIDLVVMATHGRSGLKRWAYGSITEKVLRAAPGNMLIMRPPLSELKPHTISSEQTGQQHLAEAHIQPTVTDLPLVKAMPNDPQSALEKALLAEYLWQKGYRLADLNGLPPAEAKRLMAEASQYASLKLAQVESTAHFRETLHGPS